MTCGSQTWYLDLSSNLVLPVSRIFTNSAEATSVCTSWSQLQPVSSIRSPRTLIQYYLEYTEELSMNCEELWLRVKQGICWFACTVWENLLYSSCFSTSGTQHVQHLWIIHAATPCSHGLQVTKGIDDDKKVTSNLSLFHWQWQWHWQFIDSDNVVLVQ